MAEPGPRRRRLRLRRARVPAGRPRPLPGGRRAAPGGPRWWTRRSRIRAAARHGTWGIAVRVSGLMLLAASPTSSTSLLSASRSSSSSSRSWRCLPLLKSMALAAASRRCRIERAGFGGDLFAGVRAEIFGRAELDGRPRASSSSSSISARCSSPGVCSGWNSIRRSMSLSGRKSSRSANPNSAIRRMPWCWRTRPGSCRRRTGRAAAPCGHDAARRGRELSRSAAGRRRHV